MSTEKETTAKVKYLCGDCKKEMKAHQTGDFMSMLFTPATLYCQNNECDKYGYLTVAGIKKE